MSARHPTAIELMAYADGELDAQRTAEIEAYLESSEHGRALVGTFDELGELVRDHADGAAQRAGADDIAEAVMQRIEQQPPVSTRRPATVHRLRRAAPVAAATAALALAAAFALVVTRMGPSADQHGSISGDTRPSPTGLMVASAPIVTPDGEDKEPGVSVDAVEFGAHAGTIFYVPTDTGTTTVVWLTDDDSGED